MLGNIRSSVLSSSIKGIPPRKRSEDDEIPEEAPFTLKITPAGLKPSDLYNSIAIGSTFRRSGPALPKAVIGKFPIAKPFTFIIDPNSNDAFRCRTYDLTTVIDGEEIDVTAYFTIILKLKKSNSRFYISARTDDGVNYVVVNKFTSDHIMTSKQKKLKSKQSSSEEAEWVQQPGFTTGSSGTIQPTSAPKEVPAAIPAQADPITSNPKFAEAANGLVAHLTPIVREQLVTKLTPVVLAELRTDPDLIAQARADIRKMEMDAVVALLHDFSN